MSTAADELQAAAYKARTWNALPGAAVDEQLDLAWIDDEDWDHPDPDPRLHDLRGQGLTANQLHTIVDIPIPGGTL